MYKASAPVGALAETDNLVLRYLISDYAIPTWKRETAYPWCVTTFLAGALDTRRRRYAWWFGKWRPSEGRIRQFQIRVFHVWRIMWKELIGLGIQRQILDYGRCQSNKTWIFERSSPLFPLDFSAYFCMVCTRSWTFERSDLLESYAGVDVGVFMWVFTLWRARW